MRILQARLWFAVPCLLAAFSALASAQEYPENLLFAVDSLDYSTWPWEGTPNDTIPAVEFEFDVDSGEPGSYGCDPALWDSCMTIVVHKIFPDSCTYDTLHVTTGPGNINILLYIDSPPPGPSWCDLLWVHFKEGPLACTWAIYHIRGAFRCEGEEDEKILIHMEFEAVGATPDDDVPRGVVNPPRSHPNPFNRTTTIEYSTLKEDYVEVHVFDAAGRLVKTLVSELKPPGEHSTVWDGRDESGKLLPRGAYFYRLKTGDCVSGTKILMLK